MNKEELIRKLQMVYVGDKNALNEMIDYYDELFYEMENWKEENKKYKEVINKATNELFILKDMIYKPETREENFEIQRKISSIIKRLNGKEVSE